MGERGTAFSIRPAAGNYVYLKVIEILKKNANSEKMFPGTNLLETNNTTV